MMSATHFIKLHTFHWTFIIMQLTKSHAAFIFLFEDIFILEVPSFLCYRSVVNIPPWLFDEWLHESEVPPHQFSIQQVINQPTHWVAPALAKLSFVEQLLPLWKSSPHFQALLDQLLSLLLYVKVLDVIEPLQSTLFDVPFVSDQVDYSVAKFKH